MKLTFSTLGCPTLSLSEVIASAARNGMDAVEIRLDRENRMLGYTEDQAEQVRELLGKSGVSVLNLGTGVTFEGAEAHQDEIRTCARLARAVGARALRVFAGAFVHKPEALPQEQTEQIGTSLATGADVAAEYGIELWVETHSAYSTGNSVASLMTATRRDNVRVIWDIMHSIEFGESPMETVRLLGSQIAHVHLKDGVPPTTVERAHYMLTALGKGAVDFGEIAKALRAIGYDGYLSLEWELMWHPELAACYRDTDDLLSAYRDLTARWFN